MTIITGYSDLRRVISQKANALTQNINRAPSGSFNSSFPYEYGPESSMTIAMESTNTYFIRYATFPVKNETKFGILFDYGWGGISDTFMISFFKYKHYSTWKRIFIRLFGEQIAKHFHIIECKIAAFSMTNHHYM